MTRPVYERCPEEKATCRGCGRLLDGPPYYTGKSAYHPDYGYRCPANHYGGFVCSRQCDIHATLEMESSFPGAGECKNLRPERSRDINSTWNDIEAKL